jgi:cold-inducible RNA-binding protein
MVGDGGGRAAAQPNRMTSKLYVGNLPFATTAQEVQDMFSQVGGVAAVDLIFDKFTGRSRGFAFINMATPEDAQKAVEKFNGYEMEGRNLTVNEARPKEERPARSFSGGGGGERRGGFGGGGREDRGGRSERNFRR